MPNGQDHPHRYCRSCGHWTYLGKGVCCNTDPNDPCPLNNPGGAASSSNDWQGNAWQGTSWQNQHQQWQNDVWEEEKMNAKAKRRQWWASKQKAKKQKWQASEPKEFCPYEGPSTSSKPKPDDEIPGIPEIPEPSVPQAPPEAAAPKAEPRPRPSERPAPKAEPKPMPKPRGSAGRVPPWKVPDTSSDEEPMIIETPGPIIEELAPELEWLPDQTGFELEDGVCQELTIPYNMEVTTLHQWQARVTEAAVGAAEKVDEAEDDDEAEEEDCEEELPLESDPVISSWHAAQEAKKYLQIALEVSAQDRFCEPCPEPIGHTNAFDEEPDKELSQTVPPKEVVLNFGSVVTPF